MTAYRNCTATGETPWGVTTYRYDVRDTLHYAPSTTVTARTSYNNSLYRGPSIAEMATVLVRADAGQVHFVNRNVKPTQHHYGRRTFVSAHEYQSKSGKVKIRILYDCDCGARDHTALDDWRKAITSGLMGQCMTCVRQARARSRMEPKAERVARQAAELQRLPYMDRRAK